jgi:hypothetical protein
MSYFKTCWNVIFFFNHLSMLLCKYFVIFKFLF